MLYSLDTNAVSDIQRNSYNVYNNLKAEILKGNEIAICDIVYYEIVRGLKATGAKNKLKEFFKLYEKFTHLPLNMTAINRATEIYKELHRGQQIEDNDVYIAATAIVNGCTLVTANVKHFSRIDGLSCENWR